ncbi:putative nad dependent epimerase [Phaeomoniella chlamydospora]|uniref:Putative nad dependent epimerase n=1 Tax=Phaeomoniella chlamydospora TaxID=158046 RepID=A0A0G2DX54_PHACM|nr:putative nad dependent epimerase [Phaeomoniella chlamydospora]
MPSRTVLITGANGYIGNAVCRAFVRAGWTTYGLIRSERSAISLAAEEVLPVIGNIDDISSHGVIKSKLSSELHAIISTTEDIKDYIPHYNNTIRLLRTLSESSTAGRTRPLVIFTSGCKDYGVGPHFANDAGLKPHTEESLINPPALLKNRATYSQKIFDHTDVFDPVLVRPTNVYGRSSSYYLAFFKIAAQTAATKDKPLVIPVRKDSICHALHVDDCGDAYVAIAAHHQREEVVGQAFNISSHRYETVEDIAESLINEYGIAAGVKYVDDRELAPGENPWPMAIVDFPQWTGSEKLRKVTSWKDRRLLFSEAIHVYRVAYEANDAVGHDDIARTEDKFDVFHLAVKRSA